MRKSSLTSSKAFSSTSFSIGGESSLESSKAFSSKPISSRYSTSRSNSHPTDVKRRKFVSSQRQLESKLLKLLEQIKHEDAQRKNRISYKGKTSMRLELPVTVPVNKYKKTIKVKSRKLAKLSDSHTIKPKKLKSTRKSLLTMVVSPTKHKKKKSTSTSTSLIKSL